ncbi:RHS repeat-associated protein [Streptomyces sp. SAI-135]|uniref:RHS repeat domain-containing protein n=1 Tax=unclassified Streptomyces TaxID=2593676 RepID=UPI002474E5A7|nr:MULTISPECIES: RHS repeat-associated core domain-containing protein [unclassified Streptomyces]MDH6521977.1 RHS repeat-associated protein [Streptomyces sp. SAI-090]MDH6573346.1 RHS repeat-associated protein [Streptomyces sp. SAI-117]MDH6613920.1 RHS repeat-associated protein [Streptomyces sp. SAI-135]
MIPSGYDFAAQAQSTARKKLEERPDAKIDKVGVLKPGTSKAPKDKAAPAARETRERLKKTTWPTTGTASADVPASGGTTVTVGGLGVRLAQQPTTSAAKAPKSKTAPKGTGPAEKVALRLHSQAAAKKAGVNGVLLTVDPAGTASGKSTGDTDTLRVSLDYSSFSDVYGGNFGPRLRLVTLPACALTTPQKKSCRTQRPVTGADNDAGSQTLTGTVSARTLAAGTPMVMAAAADSSGGGSDYSATSLSPTATWEAGGSTGDFTWNYPLRVPPATAGPAPNLSISYNSASVDGRTAGENNQTSVIGEGFSLTESYIERKYSSCKDDGQSGKGDQCWKYANATLVLNGKAVELVNACTDKTACDTAALSQASGGTWKLKNEDGTRVEHLTGATGNGDDNTEYWKVTDASGIQYFFGKHRLPGWSDKGTTDTTDDDPVTNSVWTVPVFGDDPGEPCYKSTGFADSSCNQAWRWNLDYAVDPHGNASAYWYTKETNYYSKNADTTVNGTAYTRGGYLNRIDYGLRSDLIYAKPAAQQVRFTYAERCVVSGGCSSLTADTKANWPDVPFDMICASGSKCTTQIGPSFFTRKRLTDITTSVWTGSGTTQRDVDTWHLDQSFPDTGDASSPSLWLKSIQNTGKANTTAAAMPPVVFGGIQLSNHVEGSTPDTLRYIKWRVRTIKSETGSTITVNYSAPDCIWGTSMPANIDSNKRRCFPVKWSQSGATPVTDWFHKYVVTSVLQDDPYGHGDTNEKYYDYQDGAGWAYADDEGLTKASNRTWSQWRGYSKVVETSGDSEGPRSKKSTLFMRGLNGEKELDGTARVEKVTDSTGTAIDDSRQYAGFVRETIVYNGTEELSGTINTPWSHKTGSHTYNWGTTDSWIIQAGETATRTKTSTGTRTVTQKTTYDPTYGMPMTVEDSGDAAKTGDESCVKTSYARNTTAWLVDLVSRTETYSVPCATTPVLPDDVVSDITTAYDNQAVGAAPTLGEITASYRVASYDADKKPVYQQVSSSTYDKLGRTLTATNALNRTIKTTYVPDDTGYGPLTSKTTTDPKLYTSTTDVDPAWGTATKTTDANGNSTEWSFDALGRLRQVWKPDRSRALQDAASIVYTYSINNDKETWVRTDALKADGNTYNSSYEIFDGLLRSRQKQVPAPGGGRVISETLYDDRGLAYITNAQVHDNNAPSGTLANTFPGSVPASTETVYDAAGRATDSIFRVYNQEKWRTKTDDQGDRTAVTAAEGGTGTLTINDARGRITERREYGGPAPTGSDYTRTLYEYTPGGQLKRMTGPDGAVWTYGYDLRGRKTTSTDPDKGKVDTTYNDADQPLTVTSTLNSASRTLITDYDELSRKIGTWDGVKDNAHQLTKFTYDSLAKGQPTAAIRYVGGTAGKIYSQVVTGYDALGRPKGTKTVIAAADPLAQALTAAGASTSFTTSTVYNIDGTVQSTSVPAVAGLPAEAVENRYNDLGMLISTDGMTDYVQNIGYSPYGEIEETRLGTSTAAKQLQIFNRYEDGTRRLTNTHTLDQTNAGYTNDVDYVYDATGNVKSVTDKANGTDTQCFTYDGYRRLTEAWTPSSNDCATGRSATALGGPAPYWTSWTYKIGGLRDSQTEHKTTDTKTIYGYPTVNANGTGQPHTLTSVTVGSGTAKPYIYDEQGNTTQRYGATGTAQSLVWDIEGELSSLTEGTKTTDYLYDANGELLIRRGPIKTVLYLAGQELHYDTAAKKFTAQRYYPSGDATAVRTETSLSWMVDDHHGTASMTVDAATQAITRRYTKPFGEARGTTPAAWPDDKGFLGKPADADTGLTHVGAREYDPATGRFLSVDPVLAPEDHESLNSYAYANNTPVTKSDPTGLKPVTDCERGCNDGNGGRYHDYMTPGPNGTWVYHSTQTYTQTFQYQKTGGGTGSGTMTVTVRTDGGVKSAQVVFKKGPDPAPEKKEQPRFGLLNGSYPIPENQAAKDLLADRPKLETWQKVLVGGISAIALAVVAAPVAVALGEGCLATAPVCAAEIAEMVTGGASGGSAVVGTGAAASAVTGLARRTSNTGAFAELAVPMQKRVVNQMAAKAGVGLDGVKVKINRDTDLLGRQLYGHTSPDGTITLYPDAFRSEEDLVRTIGHERMHVMQAKIFGSTPTLEEEQAWERAAYAAEDQFWNYYNGKLK